MKVNRNINSKVKYRCKKKILKYINKVFLLCYYTPLVTRINTPSMLSKVTQKLFWEQQINRFSVGETCMVLIDVVS